MNIVVCQFCGEAGRIPGEHPHRAPTSLLPPGKQGGCPLLIEAHLARERRLNDEHNARIRIIWAEERLIEKRIEAEHFAMVTARR